MHSHFSGYMSKNLVPVLQFHPEHRIRQRFHDLALYFYYVVFGHASNLTSSSTSCDIVVIPMGAQKSRQPPVVEDFSPGKPPFDLVERAIRPLKMADVFPLGVFCRDCLSVGDKNPCIPGIRPDHHTRGACVFAALYDYQAA